MAHGQTVENGKGSCGTGRISASGIYEMKRRTCSRTPARRPQAGHAPGSTRRCRIVTRFTSAEHFERTSARSWMRLPAATTRAPRGSACSPIRRSDSRE